MRRAGRLFAPALLALLGAGSSPAGAQSQEPGRWREIRAMDPGYQASAGSVAVDRTGTVWLPAQHTLFRWDGADWTRVEEDAVDGRGKTKRSLRAYHMRGDSARGLYIIQQTGRPTEGKLLPLEGAQLRPPIPFYKEDEPGIFVASSSRVFQFAQRTVGVLDGDSWTNVEAPLADPGRVDVVDMGPEGPVLFFPAERSTAALFDGKMIHPAVPVPDFGTLADPRREIRTRFTRFGRDLVLPWAQGQPLQRALRVVGATLVVEDLPPAFRGVKVVAARPDGRGGIWLFDDFASTRGSRPSDWREIWWLRHVGASGAIREFEQIAGERTSLSQGILGDGPFLSASDGSLWTGVGPRIHRFRAGRTRVTDWRQGLGSSPITGLAEGPDGRIYASCKGGAVWTWEEESPPPAARLDRWTAFRSRAPILRAPGGSAWVFPVDKPETAALVSGSTYQEFPFSNPAGHRVKPLLADDSGGLVLTDFHANGLVQITGIQGPATLQSLRDAVVARVAMGARNFTGFETLPPVVGADGRIWMRDSGGLCGWIGGKWEEFRIGTVPELALAADGVTPLVIRDKECLAYEGGTWKAALLEGADVLKVLGTNSSRSGAVYHLDPRLPASWRAGRLLLGRSPKRSDWRVVPWSEADALLRGETELPVLWTGHPSLFNENLSARPDGTGGFFAGSGRHRVRVTEGLVVAAHGTGTPMDDDSVRDVGFDRGGRLLAVIPLDEDNHELLIDRTGAPAIRPGPAEVVRGRCVSISWEGDPSLVAVELREAGTAAWTSFPAPAPATWSAPVPGQRPIFFEMRGRDSLGVAGPIAKVPAEIDARYPAIAWSTESGPLEVREASWRLPLHVEWTRDDVPRVVEVRVDGGKWVPLPEDGTMLFVALDDRSVSLEARAVEEGAFPTPILATTVSVEIDVDRWIRKAVRLASAGDRQSLDDLRAVRERALRILKALLEEDPMWNAPLRKVWTDLQPMRCGVPD